MSKRHIFFQMNPCKMHALKLFDLIKLKNAMVMFKAYNNMLHVNLQTLFVRVEPIFRTRNVNILISGC